MSEHGTLTRTQVVLGKLGRLHLPQLADVEEQGRAPRWDRQDFVTAFESGGAGGAVAEVNGRVLGFAVYRVTPPPDGSGWGRINGFLRSCWPWGRRIPAPTPHVDLLRAAVLPEWQRQG